MGGYVYTSATFLPSLQTLLPPSSRQSGMFRFLLPVQFIWNIVSWLSGARLHQPKGQETVCKNCEVAPGGWIQVAPQESCNALVPRWPVTGQVPSRYDRVWAVRPPREAPLHLVQRSQRAFWKLQQCQVCSSGPFEKCWDIVTEFNGLLFWSVFSLQLPASKPWKPEWKENVFAMYNGSEDRVQYWQARYGRKV